MRLHKSAQCAEKAPVLRIFYKLFNRFLAVGVPQLSLY